MTAVHVVVPDGIDDPARPSGGNAYDRRVCRGLAAVGWSVHEHPMPGDWPRPDAAACAGLAGLIAEVPDGAVVLIDGLIASSVPEVLVPEAGRLSLVVLVHLPLGDGLPGERVPDARTQERAVLSAAVAVVTTSMWTRRWLLDRYTLSPARVHVAEPGVDAADLAAGTAAGGELLCVAAVTPGKGHDVLLAALATLTDLPWRCVCVGTLTRDPGFVERLGRQAREGGISGRVRFAGPRTGADLDVAYATADALVLATRAETYGMVVTEALARGLPVVATTVGGVPEALGRGADGSRPGLLVPPGDREALAAALRRWLGDTVLRQRFRKVARERRLTLPGWSATSVRISRILAEVAGMTAETVRVSPAWLRLREPADAAARASDLVQQIQPYLPAGDRALIHDLGCGAGSMGRWLAPRLTGTQHWVMYDRDADLLTGAASDMPGVAADGAAVTIQTRQRDITRLDPGDLAGASLITASALLDMLTADELERFVTTCARAGCPVLVTISVIGRVDLTPADPLDARIAGAFNAHQRRTTGGRRLLGPDAVSDAVDAFNRLGLDVLVRPSHWRLGAAQADLTAEWFSGWVGAACEQQPELTVAAAGYARRRLAEATAGRLSVRVHHHDLLARPR